MIKLIDYLVLFEEYFLSVEIYKKKPSLHIANKAKIEKLSPFYDHPDEECRRDFNNFWIVNISDCDENTAHKMFFHFLLR